MGLALPLMLTEPVLAEDFQATTILEIHHAPAGFVPQAALTSDAILEGVARRLELEKNFGMAEGPALWAKLRGVVEAKAIPGTNLVEVVVTGTSKQAAAELAHALAQAYQAENSGQVQKQGQPASETGLATEAPDGCYGPARERLIKPSQYQELIKQIDILKAQLAAIQGLEGEELVRKVMLQGLADSTIQRYYQQFLDVLIEEKNAEASGLGGQHPTRQAIQKKLDILRYYMTSAAQWVRESLELRLQQGERDLVGIRVAPTEGGKQD
jgi:hypothetical protein